MGTCGVENSYFSLNMCIVISYQWEMFSFKKNQVEYNDYTNIRKNDWSL